MVAGAKFVECSLAHSLTHLVMYLIAIPLLVVDSDLRGSYWLVPPCMAFLHGGGFLAMCLIRGQSRSHDAVNDSVSELTQPCFWWTLLGKVNVKFHPVSGEGDRDAALCKERQPHIVKQT